MLSYLLNLFQLCYDGVRETIYMFLFVYLLLSHIGYMLLQLISVRVARQPRLRHGSEENYIVMYLDSKQIKQCVS